MEIRRDVFQSIADPTRRAIIGLVAEEPRSLNKIAEQFDISRPAISQHIKILSECGLLDITQFGRERYCEVRFEKLDEVTQWVEKFKQIWHKRLDALEQFLENNHEPEIVAVTKKKGIKK